MKKSVLMMLLCLFFVAGTYNDYDGWKIDGVQFNFTGVGNRIILENAYYVLIVALDDCSDADVYQFCLENISYSPVEYWPGEYEVVVTWEKTCDNCTPIGAKCKKDWTCDGVCVHEYCRPSNPWCGDDHCDENESCVPDCGEPEEPEEEAVPPIEETLPESNESINETNTTEPVVEETVVAEPEEIPPPRPEPTPAPSPAPRRSQAGLEGANIFGAVTAVVLGIIAIVAIFVRKRKKKKEDLFVYK